MLFIAKERDGLDYLKILGRVVKLATESGRAGFSTHSCAPTDMAEQLNLSPALLKVLEKLTEADFHTVKAYATSRILGCCVLQTLSLPAVEIAITPP